MSSPLFVGIWSVGFEGPTVSDDILLWFSELRDGPPPYLYYYLGPKPKPRWELHFAAMAKELLLGVVLCPALDNKH